MQWLYPDSRHRLSPSISAPTSHERIVPVVPMISGYVRSNTPTPTPTYNPHAPHPYPHTGRSSMIADSVRSYYVLYFCQYSIFSRVQSNVPPYDPRRYPPHTHRYCSRFSDRCAVALPAFSSLTLYLTHSHPPTHYALSSTISGCARILSVVRTTLSVYE